MESPVLANFLRGIKRPRVIMKPLVGSASLRNGALNVWFLSAWLAACGDPGAGENPGRPLFDDRHQPDVLTESRRLLQPPSTDGNRFVAGWWPWHQGGVQVLTALDSGARLEIVHLELGDREPRRRTLILDLLDSESTEGAVRVSVAGHDLGRRPLADPLMIELPNGLPVGRVLVRFLPEKGTKLTVVNAATRTARPAGEAHWQDSDLFQSGHSQVDIVHRVEPGTVLSGLFYPPSSPRNRQEFRLLIEHGEPGEPGEHRESLFGWTAPPRHDFWKRSHGPHRIEVPLGSKAGLIRFRFQALGEGPAARWSEFALHSPSTEPSARVEASPIAALDPPRLVLLYVMDALRADRLTGLDDSGLDDSGLDGPRSATPNLDRLAREGLAFTNHRSVAPNTLPSTKALLVGRAFVDNGGWQLPIDGPVTLAEAFRDAGYATALFSNNPYVSATYGVDRGFDHVAAPTEGGTQTYFDDAEKIHAAALDWLGKQTENQPVFLYLHTLHPHNPYAPPPAFTARHTQGIASTIDGSTPTLVEIQRFRLQPNEADRKRLAGLYTASLAYNDAEFGKLLTEIAKLYRPEETVIATTSDHGEELFDHDGVLHGYTLYEEMTRIPLILWSPGRVPRGRRHDATDTLDLHATFSALAGQQNAASEGASLLSSDVETRTRQDNNVHFAAAASLKGGIFSAQSRRWKLIWAPRTGRGWGMGEALGRSRDAEYLFDLVSDPGETINLAGNNHLEVAWLKSRLLAWINSKRSVSAEQIGAGELEHVQPQIDEATRQRLEALGYID